MAAERVNSRVLGDRVIEVDLSEPGAQRVCAEIEESAGFRHPIEVGDRRFYISESAGPLFEAPCLRSSLASSNRVELWISADGTCTVWTERGLLSAAGSAAVTAAENHFRAIEAIIDSEFCRHRGPQDYADGYAEAVREMYQWAVDQWPRRTSSLGVSEPGALDLLRQQLSRGATLQIWLDKPALARLPFHLLPLRESDEAQEQCQTVLGLQYAMAASTRTTSGVSEEDRPAQGGHRVMLLANSEDEHTHILHPLRDRLEGRSLEVFPATSRTGDPTYRLPPPKVASGASADALVYYGHGGDGQILIDGENHDLVEQILPVLAQARVSCHGVNQRTNVAGLLAYTHVAVLAIGRLPDVVKDLLVAGSSEKSDATHTELRKNAQMRRDELLDFVADFIGNYHDGMTAGEAMLRARQNDPSWTHPRFCLLGKADRRWPELKTRRGE
jgi:hypothetical protein